MKFRPLILLIVAALQVSDSLNAMISKSLARAGNGAKVLLLGDEHFSKRKASYDDFSKCLGYMALVPVRQRIPFLVECGTITEETVLPDTLKQLLEYSKTHKEQFDFEFFDPRDESVEEFSGLTPSIAMIIQSGLPEEFVAACYSQTLVNEPTKKYDEMWKKNIAVVKQNVRKSSTLTIAGYRKSLESCLEIMHSIVAQYHNELGEPTHPKLVSLMRELILRYQNAQQRCLALLAGFPDEYLVKLAYCEYFEKCPKASERVSLLTSLEKLFEKETEYLFVDFCFFEKLLVKLQTEPCVCVYVGSAHWQNLTRLLEAYGCTVLDEKTALMLHLPLAAYYHRDVETVFDTSTIDSFLEQIRDTSAQNVMLCSFCGKQSQQPKSCSACMKASYCDQQCQHNHWSSHKVLCKLLKK